MPLTLCSKFEQVPTGAQAYLARCCKLPSTHARQPRSALHYFLHELNLDHVHDLVHGPAGSTCGAKQPMMVGCFASVLCLVRSCVARQTRSLPGWMPYESMEAQSHSMLLRLRAFIGTYAIAPHSHSTASTNTIFQTCQCV